MHTVSIVIVNYNGREDLAACLSSLFALDYPQDKLEIIVVDNASTDDTLSWLTATCPIVRCVANSENVGFARGINRGAEIARGEYLAFLNPDMRVDPPWLAALVTTIQSEPDVASAGSVVLNWAGNEVDFAGRPTDAFNLAPYAPPQSKDFFASAGDIPLLFASGGAMLIKRDVFHGIGGFDPDYFMYHEDVDLGWRLWQAGYRVLRSAESRVYHKGSTSSRKLPRETVLRWEQKHRFFTVLKNMEDAELWRILPGLIWFWVENAQVNMLTQGIFEQALQDVIHEMDAIWKKRVALQRTRLETDAKIFSACGHPFAVVLQEPLIYEFRHFLEKTGDDLSSLPIDAPALSNRLLTLSLHAYKFNGKHLLKPSRTAAAASARKVNDLVDQVVERQKAVELLAAQLADALGNNPFALLFRATRFWRREGTLPLLRRGLYKLRYRASPGQPVPLTAQVNTTETSKTDVICFAIIDWHFRFQRPQQILTQFAQDGHRVFYLSISFAGLHRSAPEIRPIGERIFEVILPGDPDVFIYKKDLANPTLEKMLAALRELARQHNIHEAICLVDHPTWTPLVRQLKTQFGWKVVYDCMDDLRAFDLADKEIATREDELGTISDLIVTSSWVLFRRWTQAHPNCLLLPNAGDYAHFSQLPPRDTSPLAHLPRPVIGYYGEISARFDVEAIFQAVTRHPEWSFVLIGDTFGPGSMLDKLRGLANVHLLGEKPYAELPAYLAGFDVCTIPFLRIPLTEATNPVKVFEYLSAGKPVVATKLPELEALANVIYLYSTPDEFVRGLEQAISENSTELAAKRQAVARENTWRDRYQSLKPRVCALYDKVSIIIVTWNNLKYTRQCVESVLADETWPNYDLIIVDNASSDGTVEYLQALAGKESRVKIVLNESNVGFAAANNIGLRQAQDSKFVALLNNDTVVPRGWLARLLRHARRPEVGMVGPTTNWAPNEARIDVSYTDMKEMEAFAQNRMAARENQVFDIKMLTMYCVVMRKSIADQIGPLDERYEVGTFEDDDYARRVQEAGYRVICAEDVFVHHHGRASFSKLADAEYRDLFERNRRRYEEKWGEPWVLHRGREQ